jgi:hypothetical protein
MKTFFPWLMAAESFSAAVFYIFAKDWRHAMYWFFAGCITVSVII